MLRRLTKEKLEEILEAGIAEFGEQGLERTSMSRIAARAGTSVGVLYKSYKDKDDFFLACVRNSLRELDEALSETICREEKLRQYAERLIEALQRHCREHPSHIKVCHPASIPVCLSRPSAKETCAATPTRSSSPFSLTIF